MSFAPLFIGGEEVPAASGARFAVRSPWDGALVGEAARADGSDVARAVAAADRAASRWGEAAPRERERPLLAAADLVARTGEARLVPLLVAESGSTLGKSRAEVEYTVELLRAAAGESRRLYGETMPHDRAGHVSLVFREPLGVVAALSPFNAPLALFAKMIAFPLAAGNAVIAKPSEKTPLVAAELTRMLHESGLPPGVLSLVHGFGVECGEPLVADARVRGIAFTGSTTVGRRLAAVAAPEMRRLQLELGGKNALVVLADADPVEAAAIAAAGAFAHGGQICMAPSRIIVERPLYERFVAALVDCAEALHLGGANDAASAYGPLIDAAALAKVERHVAEAVAGGARLATGGRVHQRLVYRPTVLLEPPRLSAVWREETFGPVTSAVAADDLADAVALANDSVYGLSAGVLTRDLPRALAAARRIRAGAVHLGMHPFQSNALAPVGGVGASGLGRSGGRYSIDAFTELKWVSAAYEGAT